MALTVWPFKMVGSLDHMTTRITLVVVQLPWIVPRGLLLRRISCEVIHRTFGETP